LAVDIQLIALPRDTLRFIRPWWRIYQGEPGWVPPLILDRKKFLDPARNPYFQRADVQCFVAVKDGVDVGTIAATVDHAAQQNTPGVGFFGFFEFVDDAAVAGALLDAARGWLRAKGMTRMQGPFNFNSNHDFGLLVDGFDTPACIANPHARPYYGLMCEKLGLTKCIDWYAYWLDAGPVPESVRRVSERFLARNPQVRLRRLDLRHFDREVAIFRDIYNDAWERNWGHVALSEAEFQALADDFKQVLDPDLAWIAEVDGEPAALTVTLPDYNQVFKPMNGRFFPFGWWYWLTARRRIDQVRVFILGVKKRYQHMPLGAPLYVKTWEEAMKRGMRGGEASLVVENNVRMRGALERLGARIYKTYRIYERVL
jgi:GNAT superfamily N-acetyltransferase